MLDSIGIRESPNPTIIVEQHTVLQCNKNAYEQGIREGQTIATALSLFPDLSIRQRQPEKEVQLLEGIALWAYRFTPTVSIDTHAGALHIEVRGSLRLHRGFNKLYQKIVRGIGKRKIHYYSGLAHNPSAAYLVSYGDYLPSNFRFSATKLDEIKIFETINSLPITLLPCDKEIKKTLQSMGITQIDALLKLPEAALKKRFGKNFHQLIKFLKGSDNELKTLFTPTDIFLMSLHFAGGLDNKQQLHHPIQKLLIELQSYLRLRQWVNRVLEWELHYIDGEKDLMSVQSSHNFFDLSSLIELTLMKFENFEMRSNVETLTLSCSQFENIQIGSSTLFDSKNDNGFPDKNDYADENFTLLLDKLSSRLGENKYYMLSSYDDHLPEKSWHKINYNPKKNKKNRQEKTLLPRPLWLLSKPLEIHKKQKTLYWQGHLDLLQGPERIDTQWWKHHEIRDYYIARHTNGSIVWIFKDQIKKSWFLHGMFS